jgi:hypothetical protein
MESADAGAVKAEEEETRSAKNAAAPAFAPVIRAMKRPLIVNKELMIRTASSQSSEFAMPQYG